MSARISTGYLTKTVRRREPGGRQFTIAQSITITEILGFLLRSTPLHPFCDDGASCTVTSLANFGFQV
jgi:hypothetical protein